MQQGMCLMGVTNLCPKWKIYNAPMEKVVSYSFLLKQKGEFQQFISRLKSEVSNIGSCCILDKMSVTSGEKELNIYIFDRSVGFNSLHLKVILLKQNLRKKITSLIHLASKNNAMSKLQNLCMYIKCKECNLWETFYNMFAFLLKKSCQSLIGTQFYISLVCKGMMANERKLLHSLGNRFFNAKSKQTCVEISFTPIIHAQENISNFLKSQTPIVQQTDIIRGKAKVLPGPDHMLKPINVILKRKFNNTGNDRSAKTLKVSHEFCKKLSCDCQERNKWKVYKKISRQPVNYIDLLKTDFDFSDMEYSEIHSIPSENFQNPEFLYVSENVKTNHSSSKKLFSNSEFNEKFYQSLNMSCPFTRTTSEAELFQTGNIRGRKPNDKADEMCASQINSKIISNQAIIDKTKNLSYSECKNQKEIKKSSESVNNALVANERKKVENKQTCMLLHNSIQVPAESFQSCNINVNVGKLLKGFQSNLSCKASAAPKAFQSSNFSVGNPEVVGFQTAAGKSLNISEKAILAAQKMFDEVCSQEINLFDKDEAANSSKSKKPVYPVENNIDNEFNSDFADKFFEEFPFDDKESELESKVKLSQSISIKLDKVSQVGKVRKSLGGRRSLKPYSVKK